MVERYDYANIEFVDADPAKFATKPKPEPRKPLPEAITNALVGSAVDGAPVAVVVPGPEKAARNLVHRMRAWVGKELDKGKSVRAKVEPNGDGEQGTSEPTSHTVTFVVVGKRVRKTDAGEQPELPLEDGSDDAPAPEKAPAKSRRSRK